MLRSGMRLKWRMKNDARDFADAGIGMAEGKLDEAKARTWAAKVDDIQAAENAVEVRGQLELLQPNHRASSDE